MGGCSAKLAQDTKKATSRTGVRQCQQVKYCMCLYGWCSSVGTQCSTRSFRFRADSTMMQNRIPPTLNLGGSLSGVWGLFRSSRQRPRRADANAQSCRLSAAAAPSLYWVDSQHTALRLFVLVLEDPPAGDILCVTFLVGRVPGRVVQWVAAAGLRRCGHSRPRHAGTSYT